MFPANRKNSSSIWMSFTKTTPGMARCISCSKELKYVNGTSNMLKHVRNVHGHTPSDSFGPPESSSLELEPTKPVRTTPASSFRKADSLKIKRVEEKLLKLVYKDMLPFSIVDGEGFREFCHELDPKYTLPSRQTLKRKLEPTYQRIRNELKEELRDVEHVAITIDAWTSCSMMGYLTVTLHYFEKLPSWTLKSSVIATRHLAKDHTSNSMNTIINEVLEEFEIKEKLVAVTTDNEQAMVSLVEDCLCVYHVNCFAHSLNLIVKEAINQTSELKPLIQKVKAVVNFFHSSAKATTKLMASQQMTTCTGEEKSTRGVGRPLKLKNEVETRWNSIMIMLRRYCALHECVTGTLMKLKKPELIIADSDVEQIKVFVECLVPFEDATVDLSTEKNTSLSKILVVTKLLSDFLQTSVTQNSLCANLLAQLNSRLGYNEDNFTLAAATLLDPRFKREAFNNEDTRKQHEQIIIDKLRPMFSHCESQPSAPASCWAESERDEPSSEPPKKKSYMDIFRSKIQHLEKTSPQILTGPTEELNRYMRMTYLPDQEDPTVWWKEHSVMFPHLAKLARSFLFIPATSVPSERLFSKSGGLVIVSAKSHSTIDKILFLNKSNHI